MGVHSEGFHCIRICTKTHLLDLVGIAVLAMGVSILSLADKPPSSDWSANEESSSPAADLIRRIKHS